MGITYDNWLTTTPEDEADAAAARQTHREGLAQRKADAAEDPPVPVGARRVFAAAVWDPVRKCAVPDTVGTLVYPEDYMYDPLSRRGFE